MTDVFTTRLDGPAPEVDVSKDISKRGLLVAPVIIAVCFVIWGADGAWSAAYWITIVLANFLLSAAIVYRRKSPRLRSSPAGARVSRSLTGSTDTTARRRSGQR